MLGGVITIAGGILAASGFIIKRMPNATTAPRSKRADHSNDAAFRQAIGRPGVGSWMGCAGMSGWMG
jgi:hypothetical protein